MSPPEVWGPAVWTLFHTLIEKVNDQAYPFIKVQLFGQIRRICGFLPCPECSADATNFLAKVNINDLKTKVDFRNTFYVFHNMVNAKKRKPLFNYSKLASYNNYGIVPVINNFISKYNTKGNMKLLAESFQRKMVLGEFKSWFTKTIRAFTPPPNIPSPISEIKIDEPVSVDEVAAVEGCCGREIAITFAEEITESEATVEEVVITEEATIEEVAITEEATVEEVAITESEVTVEELAITFAEEITESEATTEEIAITFVQEITESEATVEEAVTEEVAITFVQEITESEATVEEEIVVTESEATVEESTITTVEESTITTEEESTITTEDAAILTEEVVQPKPKKGRKSKK
jgi:hypothetical protein